MAKNKQDAETNNTRWARFRFTIIGPLLSSPPESGCLKKELTELSKKQWKHPITGNPISFSVSTLERWFYAVKNSHDPIERLRVKRRSDAYISRKLSIEIKTAAKNQYREHPGWSYQLHRDNLAVIAKKLTPPVDAPSYSTIFRYMKSNGFTKQRVVKQRQTAGAILATERLESREIRSFEVDHVNALWHLDFHHGSRKILDKNGQWQKPLLLAILDDHSRLICHAQWYLDETTESLVHGFTQALQKRALPRALMSDNGSAMISAEFTQGLARLSILHQPTLPYSPYQNAKQEVFWAQIEGRLMAMLEGEADLTLSLLNNATQAWVELEYHRKVHSEIAATPLDRYLNGKNVGRDCPSVTVLKQAFCDEVIRVQRRSDGTLTINGCRFEIPSQYRHLQKLTVRYAAWNLSSAILIDPHTSTVLTTLYPQDKSKNAEGFRRTLQNENTPAHATPSTGIAPLLKELMTQYSATGLPPAYLIPEEKDKNKDKDKDKDKDNKQKN
jgi:transposase InsO family protein